MLPQPEALDMESGSGAEHEVGQLRRRRLAFAVARLCHGASNDDAEAKPPLVARRKVVLVAAAVFSCTMRWYSAMEQPPMAIIIERRATTSNEAKPSSAIIVGRANALARLRCRIELSLGEIVGETASPTYSVIRDSTTTFPGGM